MLKQQDIKVLNKNITLDNIRNLISGSHQADKINSVLRETE